MIYYALSYPISLAWDSGALRIAYLSGVKPNQELKQGKSTWLSFLLTDTLQ